MKKFGIFYIRNLAEVIKEADLEDRHRMISLTYSEKLFFKDGEVQTNDNKDVIMLIGLIDNKLIEKWEQQSKNFDCCSQEVTPSGFKPETF